MRTRPWPAAGLQAQDFSGADLVNRLGCLACHRAKGQSEGRAAPLDHVGARFSRAELAEIVTRPAAPDQRTKMPNYAYLRPRELQVLVEYLAALK